MRLTILAASIVLVCVALAGCGSIGEPLYPAANVPAAVTDLNAVEHGGRILVVFTVPPLTTDGLPLKQIGSIELRAGAYRQNPFDTDAWAASARGIDVPPPAKPSRVRAEIPIEGLIGQDLIVGVRIGGRKGRLSGWSNLASVKVEPPLSVPASLKIAGVPQGIALSWQPGNAVAWRVFRKPALDKDPVLLGKSDKPEYLDSAITYGTAYSYWIQAEHEFNESLLAGPAEWTAKDTFPPATPSGLTAVAGAGSIELSWERNTEPDFKAYRLYRAVGGGAFETIADSLAASSYSDNRIESGKTYRYAVAAVDQAGNSSERSQPAEAVAP